jgi:RNA polymerase sigma-70 factor, ECF subfamily
MARPPRDKDSAESPAHPSASVGAGNGQASAPSAVVGGAPAEGSVKPHGPPPSVNIPTISPSDHKQIRIREAEVDRALIAKAQAGDTAAFRSLVERHQRRAFSIALSLVRDENDARELVQDAFLRVFKGLGSFQGGSSFFTWLYRIITNLSIDLIRKPGRQGGDLDDKRLDAEDAQEPDFALLSRIDGADPAEVVRRREIAARLQVALEALPSYHRGVIVMREIEGLSYEEMAQVMGVSKGTIMSRLFHARQKLQRALVDCYQEQVGAVPPSSEEGPGVAAEEPTTAASGGPPGGSPSGPPSGTDGEDTP